MGQSQCKLNRFVADTIVADLPFLRQSGEYSLENVFETAAGQRLRLRAKELMDRLLRVGSPFALECYADGHSNPPLSFQRPRKRGEVEDDPRFKQPIAYAVIFNPRQNTVFAYRRSTGAENYDEDRLRGKWSWGVGGHIEASDDPEGDPILSSLKRELTEETDLEDEFHAEVLGYINDDTTEVGSVHFGILYVVEIERPEIRPRSPELASGSLRPLGELEEILADPRYVVEEWSALALPALKEYAAARTR